jgi:hypothetical protein
MTMTTTLVLLIFHFHSLQQLHILIYEYEYYSADPVGYVVEGVGLQPLDCWDRGLEFR